MIKFNELKSHIYNDLFRYKGRVTFKIFLEYFILHPGFKYTFWMRVCGYLKQKKALYPVFIISRLILQRYKYKYGIDIYPATKIRSGFYIGHSGGIVVNVNSVIGKNCNISQGVTIGVSNRGDNMGSPTIGDNVFIGPGAKIIGGIKIGNNVAIGANAVVTKDVPDNSVVAGIPAKVISNKGSEGYINNTNYESGLLNC